MSSGGRRGFPWKGLLALLALVLVVWLVIGQFTGGSDTGSADATVGIPNDPPAADVLATDEDASPDEDAVPAARPQPAPTPAPPTPPAVRQDIAQPAPAPASQTVQATNTSQPVPPPLQSTPANGATPAGTTSPASASPPASNIARQVADAITLAGQGNRIKARAQLSRVLFDTPNLSAQDEKLVRQALDDLNAELLFSRQVASNDPVAIAYQVQPGDRLINIGNRYKVPYQFIELINNTEARRLQVGQNLKLIRGPIHARVSKSRFVMDMFAIGSDGAPVYLTSFPVGLGENDGTPSGRWKVGSAKVTNPDWRNPRTGEYFTADNPENPIGEYWIPIEGVEGASVGRTGFGIHGTIEPDSIGKMKSMGCIRLADADIAMVYNMLFANESMVDVVE